MEKKNIETSKKVKLNNLAIKKNNSNSSCSILNSNVQSCYKSNTNNKETCNKDEVINNKNISNTEDSLEDFISPKKEKVRKPILNKFKIETNKVKKKVLPSKSKSNTGSKKKSLDVSQPLIESSFFKPQTSDDNETKKSIPCPLCLKPFKDDITCTNHMKTCASKNHVSTKQLLKAKQLQDRQIEERKAMGLLPTPVLPEKKKVYRSKNFSTEDDPQLQLALAVSESLYQAEQKTELEHAALLAGIPANFIKEMTDEEHRATLKNFGFTTNKPLNDLPSTRSKKKKLFGPTILQTRSKQEKDRVLTERIACILTGDDVFTQPQKNTEIITQVNSPTILRSKFLQDIEQVNNKLWDKSKLIKKCDFYVDELKSYFFPEGNETIEYKLSYDDINNENDIILSKNSVIHETMDIDIVYDKKKEQKSSDLLAINESKYVNWELTYTNNIVLDWRKALNDSATSDIIIFVKNNKYIFAHKLVFHIRYSNILLEIEPNDTNIHPQIRNKIHLSENDELSTLAFLEYIYCSNIEKNISIFDDDNLMSQVRKLGRLYPVKDLFEYLQRKQKEYSDKKLKDLKSINSDININTYPSNVNNNQILINKPIKSCNISNIEENMSSKIQETEIINDIPKPESSSILEETIINPTISNNCNVKSYSLTVSPDLFESENEEKLYLCETQNHNNIIKNEDHTNLKILNNDISLNPEKIKISSPKNNLSSSEDIYQAVTPKKLTPQNYDYTFLDNTEISKKIESEIEQIARAVTPEYNISERFNYYSTPRKSVYTNIAEDNKATEDNHLIYDAVTPPKSDNNRSNIDNFTSDLNLFLEKVRRQNAKGVFDSDSETDISRIQTKNRNPFLKKYRDDSFRYLLNNENKSNNVKRGISLIEKDVLEEESKKTCETEHNSKLVINKKLSNTNEIRGISTNQILNTELNLNSHEEYIETNNSEIKSQNICSKLNNQNKNENSGNFSISDNESQISMYSKYKRTKKGDNSIKKYRKELDFVGILSSTLKPVLSKSNSVTTSNPIRDDITLVSDSDDEENINTISNINNNSNYPLSPVNNQPDSLSITSMKNTTSPKANSQNKVIKRTKKNRLEALFEKSERENDNVDAVIEKILQSSPDFTTNRETLRKKYSQIDNEKNLSEDINIAVDKSQSEIINLSPISIISSPEPCKLDCINLDQHDNENNKVKILDTCKKKIIDEIDLIEDGYSENEKCNKWFTKRKENDNNQNDLSELIIDLNSYKGKNSFQDVSSNNNDNKLNLSSNPSTSKNSNISNLISSPIISQNSRATHALSSKFNVNKKKRSESPEFASEITRKLKTKSASSSNFTETMQLNKHNFQRSSSFVTPKHDKKLLQKSSKYEEDVTPPVDYNSLKTPDLMKELNRFGLKNQSRNKATLLLSHIYKQTHPLTALSQKRTSIYNSSSEDEEPALDKHNSRKKFKSNFLKGNVEFGNLQNSQNCSILEEINYCGPHIASSKNGPVDIKDAFFKIIEDNNKLHRKLLTYEPLPLESLHLMLKENGFKCKLDDFMDFLDEQCITFQTQSDKPRHRRR